MQYSFYGGQQGKSFEIAEVFKNKVEMMKDLMRRYQSDISIGDLVLISYGMPTNTDNENPSYADNAKIDTDVYGHTYNATLWQKIYTEEDNKEISNVTGIEIEYISKDFGLGYKLLAVLSGNTPVFKVNYNTIAANEKPSITIDNTKIDFPILTFNLPASQILSLLNTIVLDANQFPSVRLDSSNVDNPGIEFSLPQSQEIRPENVSTTVLDADGNPRIIVDTAGNNADGTKKINKPTVEVQLPQAQKILAEHVSTKVLDANQNPTVIFNSDKNHTNDDGTKKINQPSIEFQLPQTQILGLGKVTVVDADANPEININDTDINNPKLDINLPRSQVISLKPTIVLSPSEDPEVDYDDTAINTPKIAFSLPRAVKFMYGSKLGKRNATGGIYIETLIDSPEFADLDNGDYYVNEGTGFIYLVTGKSSTDRTFTYQACLAAPVPDVTTSATDTYEQVGNDFIVKDPSMQKSWSDPTEQIGLVLGFQLPRLPNLKGEIEFCGPDEAGTIEGKPTSTSEYTYMFTIPSGARFYAGDVVDDEHLSAIVSGARPGDFYINSQFGHKDDGKLYKLGIDNIWISSGSIKGDVGNPLNIIDSFIITPTQVANDTLIDISTYLEQQLGRKPDGHEIIAVTYRADSPAGGTIDTAYWYYVADNNWGRAQLTGATASLIENTYKSTGDANKAYSVTYVNNLLAALGVVLTPEEKKIKTYTAEAIEDMLTWGNFLDL